MVILGPDHNDAAAPHPDLHQFDQIGPRRVELRLADIPAGPVRVDAVPEEQLGAIHISHACQHRLIHQ